MSDEDLELLKFYHEVGIDCTLTEGNEEKKVEQEKNSKAIQSPAIQAEVQKKNSNPCFRVTG